MKMVLLPFQEESHKCRIQNEKKKYSRTKTIKQTNEQTKAVEERRQINR